MKNSCTVCRRGEIEAASSGSFCDAICDEALCQQHFVDFLVILWRAITFSSRQFLPYVENMCLSFFYHQQSLSVLYIVFSCCDSLIVLVKFDMSPCLMSKSSFSLEFVYS